MPSTLQYPSAAIRMAKANFIREYNNTIGAEILNMLAEQETSDGPSENYAWIGEPPRMELMEDELRTERLSDATYTVENDTYKIGIDFRKEDLEDDRLGALMGRARGMARVAANHPARLLIAALEAGTTDLGYDAAALYANSHPDRGAGAAQDNLLGGSGITTANLQTDLQTGLQTLAEFDAENGEPVHEGFGKIAVVAPWGLRRPVLEALNATIISNTSNVGFSDMDIVPIFSSRLSDANDWYLLHLGGFIKPLIYQQRKAIEFQTLDETSDQWVRRNIATFAVEWRGAVGYGHWAQTVKFVNT